MNDDSVKNVLADTERTLVELAGQAANAKDYDRATVILGLARELSTLADKWRYATAATQIPSTVENGESANGSQATGRRSRRTKKGSYPKFFRLADSLCKVGFSKSEGEYEHKSPKAILFLLAEAVQRAGHKGAQFTMNDILPLTSAEGSEVPSYQAYLCLSFLRSAGLIEQHGRQGYSISNSEDFTSSIQARWQQLPLRQNNPSATKEAK